MGFVCSFRGRFFQGFNGNNRANRDYQAEMYRNIQRQLSNLKGVTFICSDYDSLFIPDRSLIYCDPPYRDTTNYHQNFDHDRFYNWCEDMKKQGHTIFVSEYNMPSPFIQVWEKDIQNTLRTDTGIIATEKLYTL